MTLGKRIAKNRKRLGMTQDQLAEKLGITAQAVSKWENDQSCPDITMLPKLAEIFGITTDELLGREVPHVHEAEVVAENEQEGVHIQNGKWEFHWDSGKRDAVVFALMVLLVGTLTLISKVMQWNVSFWSILWPSALLTCGLSNLVKRFSIFHLALSVFSGYSLIANLGVWKLDIAGELVFPIMIVFFGIGLLIDALKKPNKSRFRIMKHGDKDKQHKNECFNNEDGFNCNLSFGEATHLVAVEELHSGCANVSFGELTVDLTNVERIAADCEIEANCAFAELRLLVPRRFRVETSNATVFASVDITGHPDAQTEAVISLDANVSFGQIEIHYV